MTTNEIIATLPANVPASLRKQAGFRVPRLLGNATLIAGADVLAEQALDIACGTTHITGRKAITIREENGEWVAGTYDDEIKRIGANFGRHASKQAAIDSVMKRRIADIHWVVLA